MTQFVLLNIILISLSAMLFLAAQTLPRIPEETEEKKNWLARWASSEIPYRVDKIISAWLEKIYRKLKVAILRLDNFLTERLRKMNEESKLLPGKQPKGDIKDVAADVAGEEKAD